MNMQRLINLSILLVLLCAAVGGTAQAQQQGAAERVDALKANLAASQASLRHYQWIETTNVSLNGQVKSSVQKRCYYGVDGVLQKVEVSAAPQAAPPPGLRGRIAANKKEELTTYMQSAGALLKSYVPPDPAKIQAVKDAGDVSVQLANSGAEVKLAFANYEKPGDSLSVSINLTNNQMKGLSVASYLDNPSDAVNLGVIMSALPDGTVYASETTLNAPAKNLTVVVQNSDYQKRTN
ncbi:MAG: hypothetical protein EXR85_03890 [Xanthomonadales bacterium]|nr:hypothetical protein [Xanthomonadales bacterium]